MKKYFIILCLVILSNGVAFSKTDTKNLTLDGVCVVYFTDAHEIAPVKDKYGNRGGVARLKTLIDEIRQEKPVIVVFGGDLAGGTLFGGFYKGFPIVEAFNKIPVDIANFGQHEFDFGIDNTIDLINQSDFTWITSNLKNETGDSFNDLPNCYTIIKSGIKIGFIGLTDALNTSINDKRIQQSDLIVAANKACESLKTQNVDFIIAVTQTPLATNQRILKEVNDIDLILTEEVSEEASEITYLGAKAIVSTCGNIGSMAEINLIKDTLRKSVKAAFSILPVDSTIIPDPYLQNLETKYMDELDSSLSKVVGYTHTNLLIKDCRSQENKLANLITDAFKAFYDADIALLNGGGIRADIPKGEVRIKDIYSTLPFGNTIFLANIKGEEIVSILKAGLKNVDKHGGDFIQVSGIEYGYSISSNGAAELSFVKKDGELLDLERSYNVALPDYIFYGRGAFTAFGVDRLIISTFDSPKDAEIVIDFFQEYPECSPKISGRITVENKR